MLGFESLAAKELAANKTKSATDVMKKRKREGFAIFWGMTKTRFGWLSYTIRWELR